MDIEHNPDEPKIDRTPFPWWIGWVFIAILWGGSLSFGMVEWHSIALGGLTGIMLATWAIDITGNKAPENWRKKR